LKKMQAARVRKADVRRASLSVEKTVDSGSVSDDPGEAPVLPPMDEAAKELENIQLMRMVNQRLGSQEGIRR